MTETDENDERTAAKRGGGNEQAQGVRHRLSARSRDDGGGGIKGQNLAGR